LLLIVAVFAACGSAPAKTTDAASHRMARTDPSAAPTKIGDAVTLDRTATSPTSTTAGESRRSVAGVELVMQANDTATHFVLSVTNKTGRPVGYLAGSETHFALIDQANKTLWTDQTCRTGDTTAPTFAALNPGEHVTLDSTYPGGDRCAAPAGNAYLTGGLTICLNLAQDGTCRGASDQRIQATPIAVTVS
jgi:hypothetical protein